MAFNINYVVLSVFDLNTFKEARLFPIETQPTFELSWPLQRLSSFRYLDGSIFHISQTKHNLIDKKGLKNKKWAVKLEGRFEAERRTKPCKLRLYRLIQEFSLSVFRGNPMSGNIFGRLSLCES